MDGFIDLLKKVAIDAGVPAKNIITDRNYLPGYFRSSKDWDMLIIAPTGKLIADGLAGLWLWDATMLLNAQ